jgi:hypothetical protein
MSEEDEKYLETVARYRPDVLEEDSSAQRSFHELIRALLQKQGVKSDQSS